MREIPRDLRYTSTHEWVRVLDDGTVEMGLTDHAQRALGDLVYVELPARGRRLAEREVCGVVESVKAACDLCCPLAGEITATNPQLLDAPERINQDPYGAGWIARLRPFDLGVVAELLSATEYAEYLAAPDVSDGV